MIKLIVVDMDGTLLNDQKEMPKNMVNVVRKLHEKGVKFAIASGRQYDSLATSFQEIKEELIFIAENGMFVVDGGKELVSHSLPDKAVNEFIDIYRSIPEASIVVSGKRTAYIENKDEAFQKAVHQYYTNTTLVEDVKQRDDECIKVALFHDGGTAEFVYPKYKAYEKDFMVCVSAREWMDLMIKGIHKGNALKEIREIYNIAYEETMVFGDFMNDYEMMQEGYYSYAMKNAIPEVKKVSNFITEFTNNDEGVLKEILRYFPDL